MTPYNETINNLRLFVHRIIFSFIIALYIVIQKTLPEGTLYDSEVMFLPWIVIALLIIDFCINFPFVAWKLVLWVKKRGIIDMRLFVEQKAPKNK